MTIRTDKGGKREVNLSTPGRSIMKKFKIHELMASTFFHGYDPMKYKIVHKDGDTTNNKLSNISIVDSVQPVIPCVLSDCYHPNFPYLSQKYRICQCGKHVVSKQTGRVLSQQHLPRGYVSVSLNIAEGESKCILVHQLVAHTYLRYPSDGQKYVVDHANHDRSDNRLSNLRFVTCSENNLNLSGTRKTKPIIQFTKQGDVIKEYLSITQALQENPEWSSAGICICLRNELMQSSAYGYRWQYKDDNDKNIKYVPKEGEVFKDVVDVKYYNTLTKSFETLDFPNYEVSNYGIVVNKRQRYPIGADDGINLSVNLVNGKNRKLIKVHTLVACMFLSPVTEEAHIIRFLDGNNKNCKADNLQWVSMKEHFCQELGRNVVMFDKQGNKKDFRSMSEAADYVLSNSDGISQNRDTIVSSIRACLSGYQDTAYGYRWKEQDKNTLQDN
jgi:hypothetical protein